MHVPLPELRLVAARAGVSGAPVEVVTADVMDPRSIAPVLADSARSVLQGMVESGVRRLLAVSVAGIHGTVDDRFTKYVVKPILGRVLRESFADARRMEETIGASDLDWTIVCPPRLTDRAAKGRIRSNTEGTVRGGFTITRADAAAYLLGAVGDAALVRKTVVN